MSSPRVLQRLNLIYNPQASLRNQYHADLDLTEGFRVQIALQYGLGCRFHFIGRNIPFTPNWRATAYLESFDPCQG